ncbi:MAG: AAA family ATPase [Succinivibrio sp.]|nr:AAA family ATPase [Succinivibrio sp.]
MAVYLHPNSQAFAKRVRLPFFVDKSRLLIELNQCVDNDDRKYVCISRPRRFGKTVTAQMLCAYYDKCVNSSGLFDPLQVGIAGSQLKVKPGEDTDAITKTEAEDLYHKHLNRYDVIFISMATEYSSSGNSVAKLKEQLTQKIGAELQEHFPGAVKAESSKLWDMLSDVYSQYRQQYQAEHKVADKTTAEPLVPGQFVFIIDEWDSVIRSSRDRQQEIKDYLNFLRDLLKDRDYVALAYLTGILPIKKYGDHSALNMFDEYSMLTPLKFAPYSGFTEEEVQTLCAANQTNFEEMAKWYDGYTAGETFHIFNPNSVNNALSKGQFMSYWTKTESSSQALGIYLRLNFKGLKDAMVRLLTGSEELIDTQGFENDLTSFKNRDQVLTLLVHLGYLTATPVESSYRKFLVRVPNREVREELETAIRDEKKYARVAAALRDSKQLLLALQQGDAQTVARGVARAHEQCCSQLKYNDENSLACALTLAFYCARDHYTLIREMPSGKGFADLAFIPHPGEDLPALLLELKYDDSAASALAQIKNKHYPQALEAYLGNLILAGISYDPQSKEHNCVIGRI